MSQRLTDTEKSCIIEYDLGYNTGKKYDIWFEEAKKQFREKGVPCSQT